MDDQDYILLFPEWLAERNFWYHHRPEFDFWFLDGGNSKPVFLDLEYSGKLNGVNMEALMGKSWSGRAMERYALTMGHVTAPKLVGFGVIGKADDYRLMRYGLASCLMGDGYFAYSTLEGQYSAAPWFDDLMPTLAKPKRQRRLHPCASRHLPARVRARLCAAEPDQDACRSAGGANRLQATPWQERTRAEFWPAGVSAATWPQGRRYLES